MTVISNNPNSPFLYLEAEIILVVFPLTFSHVFSIASAYTYCMYSNLNPLQDKEKQTCFFTEHHTCRTCDMNWMKVMIYTETEHYK